VSTQNVDDRPVQCLPVRRPLLTLIALAALTFALGLGRQAITDADEAYYAESAREMVASGDWLTPHYNFTDRWQKPVLYYWLTAATYLVVGPGEGAARLWSALSGIALTLFTAAAARRHTADADAQWLAGAIVATSYGYFAMARLALPDLPLAACITAAIAAGIEAGHTGAHRWWVAAGLFGGLGFLLKGPVAVAVPGVVLLPIWWVERRTTTMPVAAVVKAAAVFCAVGLPWYAAMTAVHGTPYLESFFVADNLERFATDRFNAPRPIWFYPAVLAGGLFPWTLHAIGPLLATANAAVRRRLRLSAAEIRLCLWAVAPLLLFMASVGQQPRYILPILPPLAILLATAITARAQAGARDLRLTTWLMAGVFLLLAAVLLRIRPMLVTVTPAAPWIGATVLAGAAGMLAVAATIERGMWLPRLTVLAAAALLLSVQFGALAGLRPEPVEQMAAAVRMHRSADERVGPYRAFVRNLVFYTGVRQDDLFDRASAVRFLQSNDRVLLVAPAREVAGLEQEAGVRTRELFRVTYLDTALLRLDTLVHPHPEQQLQTVVLVANR
jgi:4-amino-4-deoxy-L-arabinose transferase-like glycosyltransferase